MHNDGYLIFDDKQSNAVCIDDPPVKIWTKRALVRPTKEPSAYVSSRLYSILGETKERKLSQIMEHFIWKQSKK